ncbi:MAG: glycosyltransferase family 39 protein [Bacteroidetes bacterium]|nr:glycosyltransferase family 39 protein [Bacteroidota bacterium]
MNKKTYLLLIAMSLLPLIFLRDFTTNNELRYLSIADEAIRNGTFFTFTNHGIPYADKPPLYLWFVMLGKWLLGSHQMWFLSLFSLAPAFIIVGTMNKWVKRELNEPYVSLATLMLMSCGLFLGLSVFIRMDMLMCMFITLALYKFYKIYEGKAQKIDSFLFAIYVFMAVFSKGAIGFLVPLISTITFLIIKKDYRLIGKIWSWKTFAIILILCGLWFTGILVEGGNEYLNNLLYHQTVDRAIDSFHHKEPFYYYFISMWYSMAPWTILFVYLLFKSFIKKWFFSDKEVFFFTVIATTFIMLSLISSKIAVYLLPVFPFIAYLSVLLIKNINWKNHTIKIINRSTLALFSIIFVCSIFIVPNVNKSVSYRSLCERAVEVSIEEKTDGFCSYEIKRAENLDVFLGEQIDIITFDELINQKNKVLLLNNKTIENEPKLKKFISDKKQYIIDKNSVIILQ